jgi:hypothetical protein
MMKARVMPYPVSTVGKEARYEVCCTWLNSSNELTPFYLLRLSSTCSMAKILKSTQDYHIKPKWSCLQTLESILLKATE